MNEEQKIEQVVIAIEVFEIIDEEIVAPYNGKWLASKRIAAVIAEKEEQIALLRDRLDYYKREVIAYEQSIVPKLRTEIALLKTQITELNTRQDAPWA